MFSGIQKRVRTWFFSDAPAEFQAIYPDGRGRDWVALVSGEQRNLVEPWLLRWRRIYPVQATELEDRSVVYLGAPREALRLIAEGTAQVSGPLPDGRERRRAARARIESPSRYETHSGSVVTGVGHTIDISSTGVSFTTESLLPVDTRATLHITWPVRLEDGALVELRAVGNLARSEGASAAMRLETMGFLIAN